MSTYVKAEVGLNHTVIYTDDTNRYFRFVGGTWAWRTHNPGNLFPGAVSARHNRIGSTGHFAIFPDYETGHEALLDCLHTTYANKSIPDLVKKYAPEKDGNNVKRYTAFLRDRTGVLDDRKVCDFTEKEFEKLWRAIEDMEGHKEGSVIEVYPVIQVCKNKQGMYAFHIKTLGWTPREACIQLTKAGRLDLVICTSPLGNSYLRSRHGSSVNGCLENLVVKYVPQ